MLMPTLRRMALAGPWTVMGVGLMFSPTAQASEYCVVCSDPAANYRCMTDDGRDSAGTDTRDKMLCAQELARSGGHESCTIDRQSTPPCQGELRSVTTKDLSIPDTAATPVPSQPGPSKPEPTNSPSAPAAPAPEALPGTAYTPTPQPPPDEAEPADSSTPDSKSGLGKAWDCMTSLFKQC